MDGPLEGRLVPLHRHQVVPALLADLPDRLLLAPGRVDRHQRPLQVEDLEQLRGIDGEGMLAGQRFLVGVAGQEALGEAEDLDVLALGTL